MPVVAPCGVHVRKCTALSVRNAAGVFKTTDIPHVLFFYVQTVAQK